MGSITQAAQAGTLESNDILVSVAPLPPNSGIIVDLESIVLAQYGESIRQVLVSTATSAGFADVYIKAVDKGALDCTIEARVLAALKRGVMPEGNV